MVRIVWATMLLLLAGCGSTKQVLDLTGDYVIPIGSYTLPSINNLIKNNHIGMTPPNIMNELVK